MVVKIEKVIRRPGEMQIIHKRFGEKPIENSSLIRVKTHIFIIIINVGKTESEEQIT